MYIPRHYESDLEYPDHKFKIGDIVRTLFEDNNTYCHWLVEGISYDPAWYVWQYALRVLDTNETYCSDIRAIDTDRRHERVA